jgi:hypothetical protein
MALQSYMQELLQTKKVSRVHIVYDASVAALDDSSSSIKRQGNDSFSSDTGSNYTPSPGSSLGGFRERHRRIKDSLSPVKVYKWSPPKEKRDINDIPFAFDTADRKPSQGM